jgi:hypothetical protein
MVEEIVSGNIRFSRYWRAPLEAGEYNVVVQQTVTELNGAPTPVAPITPVKYDFVVDGPRFALNPADVYSVYPPEGSTGDFERSMPHIVFARPTIPWERRICATSPDHHPWMALLLFSAEDESKGTGIPAIEPRKVRDLIEQLPPNVAGPRNLACKDYELDDPCNTIDVDVALFQRMAPTSADLGYLAHVREVDTDHKETASFLTDGSFSVIISNRFPKAKAQVGDAPVENRAILVSLEGIQDFLPEAGKPPQSSAKTLRLAVLASWGFHCETARDFKKSMQDLNDPLLPLRLDLPPDSPTEIETAKYVRAAFSRGYAALNHHTRLGEKTFSWYRGPLVPADIEVQARYDFNAVPDGLIRYDNTNGIMDLAYAGASQLGRFLGLQDRAFAQSLSAWRTDVQRQIKARLEKEELIRTLRSQPAGERLLQSPESEFLESALEEALTRKEAATERPGKSFAESLNAEAKPGDGSAKQWQAATMKELPATVSDWLARRVLLYGVPFLYLVPDERMLPMPSMRFFRIDPLWIKRLLEGACSVGRNSTEAELVDSILGDEFFRIAVEGCGKVRRRPLLNEGDGLPKSDDSPSPSFPFEGFLLRSPLVRGWQGLEIEAWYWKKGEAQPVPAPPLRIDRLAPDIMLCIFNGPLAKIEIRQPAEGMHFGADGFQKTSLRKTTTQDPGGQIALKGNDVVQIPFRGEETTRFGTEHKGQRVVDVQELANFFHEALTNKGGMDKSPLASFTSAEFAVQMTDSPGRVEIKVGNKP